MNLSNLIITIILYLLAGCGSPANYGSGNSGPVKKKDAVPEEHTELITDEDETP